MKNTLLHSKGPIVDPSFKVLEKNLTDYCLKVITRELKAERLFLTQETLKFTAQRYAQTLSGMVETEAKNLIQKDILNVKAILEKTNSPF